MNAHPSFDSLEIYARAHEIVSISFRSSGVRRTATETWRLPYESAKLVRQNGEKLIFGCKHWYSRERTFQSLGSLPTPDAPGSKEQICWLPDCMTAWFAWRKPKLSPEKKNFWGPKAFREILNSKCMSSCEEALGAQNLSPELSADHQNVLEGR